MTILARMGVNATVCGGAGLGLLLALSLGCQASSRDPVPAEQPVVDGVEVGEGQSADTTGQQPVTVEPEHDPERQDPQRQDPERQDPERQDPERGDGGRQDPEQGQTVPPFLENAFPPTVPDAEWHRNAWMDNDCLRCHETGVGEATMLVHDSLPDLAREVMCRTCHVFVPGSKPRVKDPAGVGRFEADAFPPMIPGSSYHRDSWLRADCLLCHENGIKNAPVIRHRGMSPRLLESKCRTCHVQVRAIEHDDSILRLLK